MARDFVARTLSSNQVGADAYAATLLTSEIVTNAIQHSKSGAEGGTVTIVIIGVPRGVLVEIIDNGSAGAPIVKGDLYAVEGHGLFVVQHLAAQWGYLKDSTGTTVWFHLPAEDDSQQAAQRLSTDVGQNPDVPERAGEHLPWTQTFTAMRLEDAKLATALDAAGLRLDRYLTEDRSWFRAVSAGATDT